MARLDPKEYPFPKIADYKGRLPEWLNDCDKAIAKIPKDRLLRFPVADGYAHYYIKSLQPLVLQYIDYLDGYQIPDAHIRGLRLMDVYYMLDFEKQFYS